VWLKLENHQVTGSFKARGAVSKLLSLGREERSRGIVSASTGNHGAAVAYAGSRLGVETRVYVPEHADPGKVSVIRNYGAEVSHHGNDCVESEVFARGVAESSGKAYVSPYNDIDIVIGQGTIAVELLEQLPELDAVFVALGGGGMISGIGSYLKTVNPKIEVIACSPRQSPAMHECMVAGKCLDVPCHDTLSDATAGGVEDGSITVELCCKVVDRSILVEEEEIHQAMIEIISGHRMLIEGAAGTAVAGFRKVQREYADRNVAIVVCGANIGLEKLRKVLR
jgi:threonine dehydratase